MAKWLYKIKSVRQWKARSPDTVYFEAPRALGWAAGVPIRSAPRPIYSQHAQDSVLLTEFYRQLVNARFPKVFLDIGCNHPTRFSNSMVFEEAFGFKTVAIDAIGDLGRLWKQQRPRATFINSAIGAESGSVTFSKVDDDGDGSMLSAVAGASDKLGSRPLVSVTVQTRTVNSILSQLQISAIGIASIDVEGFESQVLAGWDMNQYPASILVIENNSNHELGDTSLRETMLSRGFRHFARIWKTDDIFVHASVLAERQTEPDFSG